MRVENRDFDREREVINVDYAGNFNGRNVFHESGGNCRPSMRGSSQTPQAGGGAVIGIVLFLVSLFAGLLGKGKIDKDNKGDKK